MENEEKDIQSEVAEETEKEEEKVQEQEPAPKTPEELAAEKVKAAEAKADEYLLAAQRIQADFENYKRRNKNAISEATDDGINEAVKQFIPILDNVERAVEAAQKFGDDSFMKGMDLLNRQVKELFEKLDVVEIETKDGFDPNFHNAVMQEEVSEGVKENEITAVFQKGYIRKGKVLRYSMVKVAK